MFMTPPYKGGRFPLLFLPFQSVTHTYLCTYCTYKHTHTHTHTHTDLEPGVNIDGLETVSHCIVYIRIMTIVKPQSQQSGEGGRERGREGECSYEYCW